MAHNVTLGGNRLGSGKKQNIELHGYERSTHDLGYLWRSTMSSGTLVPFMCKVALPGDTFDINLNAEIMTHPTIGPLFGSYKVQLDVFQCPIRLYQGQLHNNKLGIGLNMANVKLPLIRLTAKPFNIDFTPDIDNSQINPSCILSYLGIRGIANIVDPMADPFSRNFNAVPFIAYWDIYKQYYSNKQEEQGAVIHTEQVAIVASVDSITVEPDVETIPQYPVAPGAIIYTPGALIHINFTGGTPLPEQIMITGSFGVKSVAELAAVVYTPIGGVMDFYIDGNKWGFDIILQQWDYISEGQLPVVPPRVQMFNLNNIDIMREEILSAATSGATPFIINSVTNPANIPPYSYITFLEPTDNITNLKATQEGLALKTYQSDLFNNWLQTEWIDGTGGISEVTAIDTSGGSFTIDTLNLSRKIYNMLNRIAVSGGSYDDWLDATYDHDRYTRCESPMYCGGLSKELVFQAVVSNSASTAGEGGQQAGQPLGTLAGRGVLAGKHKGGSVTVKVDEPSYIMGIISLTPRLDYSQGNSWDTGLLTMDDFHKPALDEIGFQELITEQMAWWDTTVTTGVLTQKSAGKQPAWINYMTSVNEVRGNFAIASNEMFMTLNRRYEYDAGTPGIVDLTTYIDPAKFNNIFAQTSLDAQNFWAQVSVDITARRKMSAKVMPNL